MYPQALQALIDEFSRLPTIGPKTAKRLAFHVLYAPPERAMSLAKALVEVKERVRACRLCGNVAEDELCYICADPNRDHRVICVVATARDLVSLEAPNVFKGVYHVLGGLLSPIDGIGPSSLRIEELQQRIVDSQANEVIIATNPTLAGESTALYLQKALEEQAKAQNGDDVAASVLKITRLAQGLPIGADLEYADAMTIKLSLDGRHQMN